MSFHSMIAQMRATIAGLRVDADELAAVVDGQLDGVDLEHNPERDELERDPSTPVAVTPYEILLATGMIGRDFREAGKGARWDRVKKYPTNIHGHPADKSRGQSRGVRPWSQIDSIGLHTAGTKGLHEDRWLGVPCHLAIAENGKIVLCHRNDAYLFAIHALNRRTINIEVAGNRTIGEHMVAPAREAVRYAVADIRQHRKPGDDRPIYMSPHVLGHRSRINDCDIYIWREVGEWALDTLGLEVGKPMGTGRPVPKSWWTPGRPEAN